MALTRRLTWIPLVLTPVVVMSCGSSSTKTSAASPTSAATSATTSGSPPTTASAGKVQLTFAGDVTGALTPDGLPTCGQTGPQSVVVRGAVGGHRGSLSVKSDGVGPAAFPSKHLADAAYLPDGTGGPSFSASSITSVGQGSLTFNPDGSGTIDLVIPFDAGSGGAHGTSVHVSGTWAC